jgi:hypothetical protein
MECPYCRKEIKGDAVGRMSYEVANIALEGEDE